MKLRDHLKLAIFTAFAWSLYVILAPLQLVLCLHGSVRIQWLGLGWREVRSQQRYFIRDRIKRRDFRL